MDRQSPQEFARWGRDLGDAFWAIRWICRTVLRSRAAIALTLISRRDYGAEMQRPAAILRFAIPKVGLWARLDRARFGAIFAR